MRRVVFRILLAVGVAAGVALAIKASVPKQTVGIKLHKAVR
jgi:hypothetical protein